MSHQPKKYKVPDLSFSERVLEQASLYLNFSIKETLFESEVSKINEILEESQNHPALQLLINLIDGLIYEEFYSDENFGKQLENQRLELQYWLNENFTSDNTLHLVNSEPENKVLESVYLERKVDIDLDNLLQSKEQYEKLGRIYYQLMVSSELDERQANRVEKILTWSENDPILNLLISEIDYYIAQKLNFFSEERHFNNEMQDTWIQNRENAIYIELHNISRREILGYLAIQHLTPTIFDEQYINLAPKKSLASKIFQRTKFITTVWQQYSKPVKTIHRRISISTLSCIKIPIYAVYTLTFLTMGFLVFRGLYSLASGNCFKLTNTLINQLTSHQLSKGYDLSGEAIVHSHPYHTQQSIQPIYKQLSSEAYQRSDEAQQQSSEMMQKLAERYQRSAEAQQLIREDKQLQFEQQRRFHEAEKMLHEAQYWKSIAQQWKLVAQNEKADAQEYLSDAQLYLEEANFHALETHQYSQVSEQRTQETRIKARPNILRLRFANTQVDWVGVTLVLVATAGLMGFTSISLIGIGKGIVTEHRQGAALWDQLSDNWTKK
jgi:hypothetical protein